MENRWAARTPVRLSVDLHCRDIEVVNCSTRDISLNGAYIEVKQLQPDADSKVDLVFRLGQPGEYTRYRVPGKVVRSDGEGIGVMFDEVDASSFRSLREILHFSQPAGTAAS